MIAAFFIPRPRLAFALAAATTLVGIVAAGSIPLSQLPDIVPPQVQVSTIYPGASTGDVEASVAQPLEAAVNGADRMIYMRSTSADDGSYALSVTFALGSDPDVDAFNVNTRIQAALSKLPPEVQREGVSVHKKAPSVLQFINFTSHALGSSALADVVTDDVVNRLVRVPGVGDVTLFSGQRAAMRVSFDGPRLAALGLNPSDIVSALRSQNTIAAAGRVGAPPSGAAASLQMSIRAQGRLSTPAQFGQVVVRANPDGSIVHLRDVAQVDLGPQSADSESRLNGEPSVAIGVALAPGANAVSTAQAVRAALAEIGPRLPPELRCDVSYDASEFVSATAREVVWTLVTAAALVAVVVVLALGSLRAALIPLIVVPVSLFGTIAGLYALGYTANTVTLFALVLSIGIVVDDAIVVVEGVKSALEDDPGAPAAEAARRAMRRLTVPIIAITLVLASVFLPATLIPGVSGRILREFGATLGIAVAISAVNALTLSPALCALWFKPGADPGPIRGVLSTLGSAQRAQVAVLSRLARVPGFGLAVVCLCAALVWPVVGATRSGFLPEEDKGAFFVAAQLPGGASLPRTREVVEQLEGMVGRMPGVQEVFSVVGYSLLDSAQESNAAFLFVRLQPFADRKRPGMDAGSLIARVWSESQNLRSAFVVPLNLPSVTGLSTTGGFEYEVEALADQDMATLSGAARGLAASAGRDPRLARLFSGLGGTTPYVSLDVDRDRAAVLGVDVGDVFSTLQASLGEIHVNDFNRNDQLRQVQVAGYAEGRLTPEALRRLFVRSKSGDEVPLPSLVTMAVRSGPQVITRYNDRRAIAVAGSPAPGFSTSDAMAALDAAAARTLTPAFEREWTGTAFIEQGSGRDAWLALAAGSAFAYLVLMALFESLLLPLTILLPVVVSVLGALVSLHLAGLAVDLYAKVGLVVLVGMVAKNGILIVDFAQHARGEGLSPVEAATAAARSRFRAVMMTSLTFIFGILPLVFSGDVARVSRQTVGVSILGGMAAALTLGLAITPIVYAELDRLRALIELRRVGRTPALATEIGPDPSN